MKQLRWVFLKENNFKVFFSCLKKISKLPQNDFFEDCLYYDCGDDANNNKNVIKTDDEMDFGCSSTDDDEEVFNTNFINNSSSVVSTSFSKSLNDIHASEKIVPTRPNSLAISTADNFSCIDHAVSTFLLTTAIAFIQHFKCSPLFYHNFLN